MPEELEIIAPFQQWMAEWISAHPPADSLADARDIIPSSAIISSLFCDLMDEVITIEQLHNILNKHEYVFSDGGWLIA